MIHPWNSKRSESGPITAHTVDGYEIRNPAAVGRWLIPSQLPIVTNWYRISQPSTVCHISQYLEKWCHMMPYDAIWCHMMPWYHVISSHPLHHFSPKDGSAPNWWSSTRWSWAKYMQRTDSFVIQHGELGHPGKIIAGLKPCRNSVCGSGVGEIWLSSFGTEGSTGIAEKKKLSFKKHRQRQLADGFHRFQQGHFRLQSGFEPRSGSNWSFTGRFWPRSDRHVLVGKGMHMIVFSVCLIKGVGELARKNHPVLNMIKLKTSIYIYYSHI